MDAPENARTTPRSRMLIAEGLTAGWTIAAVAAALGTTPRTVRKWRDRSTAEGEAGLRDRSSRPHRSPARLAEAAGAEIEALLPDEKQESAVRFLNDALAWFRAHGVVVERVMTDNGSAFRSRIFAAALHRHGLQHKRTQPYTPRTNGKAERFIQTSLREWAYARPFHTSAERACAMPGWLCRYNTCRPHSALGGKPPISRISRDNLHSNDS